MVTNKHTEIKTVNGHRYETEITNISFSSDETTDQQAEIKSDNWLHFNSVASVEIEEVKYFIE